MWKRNQILGLTAVVFGLAMFAVLCWGEGAGKVLRDPKQRAIYILSNSKWYENIDVWKAQGWSQSKPPKMAPSAVRERELSELLRLIGLIPNNEELRTHLEGYVNHQNKDVSQLALRQLVRRGDWTKQAAHRFARQAGLPIMDYEFPTPTQHWDQLRASLVEPTEREKAKKQQDAMGILDDLEWHKSDPGIARLRASQERNPPEKRGPLEGYISNREVTAIGTLIDAAMPRERKRELLTRYLEHRNESVALNCFVQLISSGMWTPKQGMGYVRENNPTPGGWHTLLHYLPKETSLEIRRHVAREILRAPRKDPPDHMPGSPWTAEIDAARILVSSTQESDHSLIRSAVQDYPEAVLLWAAASRLPKEDGTERFAREVYADQTNSLPVRCAAALVFGKDNPQLMREVIEHILTNTREFGSKEYMLWTHEGWSKPADPTRKDRLLRAKEMEGLLTVAYELPTEFLKPHVREFVQYPYTSLGAYMCAILARRLPEDFVKAVSELDFVPEELYPPLMVLSHYSTKLSEKATSFIPTQDLSGMTTRIQQHGVRVFAPIAFTLWD